MLISNKLKEIDLETVRIRFYLNPLLFSQRSHSAFDLVVLYLRLLELLAFLAIFLSSRFRFLKVRTTC